MENIVAIDACRYGFVELKYYKPPYGFEDAITFTDSVALFGDLWGGGMAEYKAVFTGKGYSIVGERLCIMQFCDLLMVWGCLRSIY